MTVERLYTLINLFQGSKCFLRVFQKHIGRTPQRKNWMVWEMYFLDSKDKMLEI